MIIIDAHEDLAYNVMSDGRNYLQSAYQTRAEEEGGPVLELNGLCTLGLPEWLEGSVAFVFSTLFTMPREAAKPGEMGYPNPEGAFQQALAQLNIYRRWAAERPQITLVSQRQDLEQVLSTWNSSAPRQERQVGLVLLMENAAPIRTPDEAEKNVTLEAAVRTIDAVCQLAGDAHHAGIGTDFDGGFGAEAIPAELDTIGDLPRLAEALTQHGYSGVDIEAIMGGNWLRLLRQVLPVSNPQSPISNL